MGSAQNIHPAIGLEKIVQKIQIKLCVIGHQQRTARPFQQAAKGLYSLGLFHALLLELAVGDAGELRNKWRQKLIPRQADQTVKAAGFCAGFQRDRADLNDTVPLKDNPSSLGIKHNDAVKVLP